MKPLELLHGSPYDFPSPLLILIFGEASLSKTIEEGDHNINRTEILYIQGIHIDIQQIKVPNMWQIVFRGCGLISRMVFINQCHYLQGRPVHEIWIK
jgi:hypothetical protein